MNQHKIHTSFSSKKILWNLFILYLTFIVLCVGLKFRGSINLMLQTREYVQEQHNMGIINFVYIPFSTIRSALHHIDNSSYRLDLFGSMLCYVPLGIFFPLIVSPNRKLFRTICFSLIIIICIESIQFFSLFGVFNIDDIILGTIGVLLGYIIYFLGTKSAKYILSHTPN